TFTRATTLALALTTGYAVAADSVPTESIHRASEVTGMTVKDTSGKDLGTVKDIVLDLGTGKVRYLALQYGGWLGLGSKLFAVPIEHFQVHRYQDSNKYYLTVNISENTLKSAPGFDSNNWPDFATDSQWHQKIREHYQNVPNTAARPNTVK